MMLHRATSSLRSVVPEVLIGKGTFARAVLIANCNKFFRGVQDEDAAQHVQAPWQMSAVLHRLLQHCPSSREALHGSAGVAAAPLLQPALRLAQVVQRLLLYVHVQCGDSAAGQSAAAGDPCRMPYMPAISRYSQLLQQLPAHGADVTIHMWAS